MLDHPTTSNDARRLSLSCVSRNHSSRLKPIPMTRRMSDNASTTSTLVDSPADAHASLALNGAVSFFVNNQELLDLFKAATQRCGMGLDNFRRSLVGILHCLAIELCLEAADKRQMSAAMFIRHTESLLLAK